MSEGVELYTPAEMRLLDAKPGITDLASIVFSDEATIWPATPMTQTRRIMNLSVPGKAALAFFMWRNNLCFWTFRSFG